MAVCNNLTGIIMVYLISLPIWINVSASMTWKLSNMQIPGLQTKRDAFIAYHNETVQILGGYYSPNDSLDFPLDVAWNTSTTTPITFGYQWSQSSIQIDEQFWMLPNDLNKKINVFDLNKKSIIQTLSFPGTATARRCVTSYNEYIFIIGGDYVKEFHIYNRLTTAWSTGTSLNNSRHGHSCNVIEDTIYIIGGHDDTNYLDSIEYLEMNANSCCNGIWMQMNNRLSSVNIYHRSVVFQKLIYVIGGYDNSDHLDQVDIIDTISKTIWSSSTNKLVYRKSQVSTILVQNIIYVFGGVPFTDNIHYQYATIPAQNPTMGGNKTQNPTKTSDVEYLFSSTLFFQYEYVDNSRTISTIIIAVAVMIVIIGCGICFFIWFRTRKHKNGLTEMNAHNVQYDTSGAIPKYNDLQPSAPKQNNEIGITDGNNDENVEYKYNKPSAPEMEIDDIMEQENRYYVGQKLMIKISKISKAPATVISIQNTKSIVIKYDLYRHDGNNTAKLHIVNDKHRIEIRGNYQNEELIKESINEQNNHNDNNDDDNNDDDNDNNDDDIDDDNDDDNDVSETKSIHDECVICMDKNKNYVCVPCGHECLCEDCKDLIDGKCPICQSQCTATMKVYR